MAFNKEFCVDNIESFQGEIWREIPNTDGKYFVSNCGRVKSYCGYNAIILKADETKKGYLVVKINDKNIRVHRLVAFAFCNHNQIKDSNLIQIHHIDKDKKNNNANNLVILSVYEHRQIHSKKESVNK